jgi:hypothetical protein
LSIVKKILDKTKDKDYYVELFERADSVLRLHRHFREDGRQAYFLRGKNGKFIACVVEEDILSYRPDLIPKKKQKQRAEDWE